MAYEHGSQQVVHSSWERAGVSAEPVIVLEYHYKINIQQMQDAR